MISGGSTTVHNDSLSVFSQRLHDFPTLIFGIWTSSMASIKSDFTGKLMTWNFSIWHSVLPHLTHLVVVWDFPSKLESGTCLSGARIWLSVARSTSIRLMMHWKKSITHCCLPSMKFSFLFCTLRRKSIGDTIGNPWLRDRSNWKGNLFYYNWIDTNLDNHC